MGSKEICIYRDKLMGLLKITISKPPINILIRLTFSFLIWPEVITLGDPCDIYK
jgi:hypothetical protein